MLNRAALLLVLLVPALAGCVGEASTAPALLLPDRTAPAHADLAFHARYVGDDTTLTLDLRPGIHRVLARDLAVVEAHRLDVVRTDALGTWEETYYLDAQRRIVRVDLPCLDLGTCDHAQANWGVQGLPAPYGVWTTRGVPETDALAYELHGAPVAVDLTVHDGLAVVAPRDPPVLVSAAPAGVYGLDPSVPVPATIQKSDHHGAPSTWTLQELASGEPLPALAPRSLSRDPGVPVPDGLLPGLDAPVTATDLVVADALAFLLDADEDAAAALADGCLRRVRVAAPQDAAPIDSVRGVQQRQFVAFTLADDAVRTWTVEVAHHHDDTLGYAIADGPRDEDGPFDCADHADARAGPGLDALDAFTDALPLRVDRSTEAITLVHGETLPVAWLAAAGTEFVRFRFAPEDASGSYTPYGPLFNLDHGWLQTLDLHPDDLERLDASFRPPHDKA